MALNGILLPSALVFLVLLVLRWSLVLLVLLVLLANDKQVLGPWTNSTAQNWVGGLIVWTVTTFSLAPRWSPRSSPTSRSGSAATPSASARPSGWRQGSSSMPLT